MVEYRIIRRNEIKKVAKMVTETFGEYPMYTLTFRDKFNKRKDFINYITKLNKVHIRANARKHKCFVGIENEEIVSVALLQDPKTKRISLWNYIVAGGVRLLYPVGLKRLIDFFDISNEAHKACEKEHNSAWYIELLAVSPNCKGQGLGSKMISDCLIPYVNSYGGREIALITNTKKNCDFYEKNGFFNFSKNELTWDKRTINNYSFIKKI